MSKQQTYRRTNMMHATVRCNATVCERCPPPDIGLQLRCPELCRASGCREAGHASVHHCVGRKKKEKRCMLLPVHGVRAGVCMIPATRASIMVWDINVHKAARRCVPVLLFSVWVLGGFAVFRMSCSPPSRVYFDNFSKKKCFSCRKRTRI